MKKRGIVTTILLVAIPFFVASHALGYTSPGQPKGFVNDFAGIIPTEQKAQLETNLSNFQKQTGNEITVVTIKSLGDETVETYAVKLFEEWGIGDKEKDNGLLLLVALDDRKMRIEVGYGLEPYITDAQASSIIRTILTPAFKEGNYSQGISTAVGTMIQVIGGDTNAIPEESTSKTGDLLGILFCFLISIPLWLASILGRSKSWWFGGVLGGIIGVIVGLIYGFIFIGILAVPLLVIIGLIFDFIVSKAYSSRISQGLSAPWWIGGGGGGSGFGGGFGGFGGGGSGGGGSSGGW